MSWSRRQILLGAGVGGVAVVAGLKPSDEGKGHDNYFQQLSQALRTAEVAQPTLIIDQQRLQHNIQQVQQHLAAKNLPVRLVVKSLPCLSLLQVLSQQLRSQRFMVFNLPMLSTVLEHYPQGDFLLGKPIAALALKHWLTDLTNPMLLDRVQWLVDSSARLQEYAELAQAFNYPLKINLEIDVGLHRGGLKTVEELQTVLQQLKQSPLLKLSGLMGYEAHVAKLPTALGMQQKAWDYVQSFYQACQQTIQQAGYDANQMTYNSGGSQTYTLHAQGTVANEIAIGSAFVQPSDFDLPTLAQHQAACFIATPVLKVEQEPLIPALEWARWFRSAWDANNQRGYFIHGGHWLAQPISPAGLRLSELYGRSSNQELWLGSASQQLKVNDYLFFRPQQSEAVFLQFGDIRLYQQSALTQTWPVFTASA
ncbi:alanine racemase [Agitococcus lubricus]|uniref:D-serine deaminase-like pyridoxal phosphate-dependent protein n=1 Tax=Agitococcus lubricus TaxID=1077255 RepID=A0A2T5J1G1_9GAMM|nr:alanine racemase [Agitococcus lubricus]PTQ90184.1 D-serine deaminase-like pyridoxal phosphate-dependent protein [Agitococcus lubricus]